VWYRDSVIQKIKERSWTYEGVPGTYIDIVNVINATSVHWAADRMVRFPFATNLFFRIKNLTVKFFSAVFH
jgi:linoleate 10R-lipoxygenase